MNKKKKKEHITKVFSTNNKYHQLNKLQMGINLQTIIVPFNLSI